jgi:hypothetical protein
MERLVVFKGLGEGLRSGVMSASFLYSSNNNYKIPVKYMNIEKKDKVLKVFKRKAIKKKATKNQIDTTFGQQYQKQKAMESGF